MARETKDFLECLKLDVTQSAANTLTTQMFQTPASKTEKMAMLIWKIQFEHPTFPHQGILDIIAIVNQVSTTAPSLKEPHVVDMDKVELELTTSGSSFGKTLIEHDFDTPMLYTKQEIGIAFTSTGRSAAAIGMARVWYTLEKVSKESYIDALVQ